MMTPFCAQCQARFGWCEYDPATDTLYASDGGECPERMETMMEKFDLAAFAQEVHQNAVAHGWWDDERSAAEVRALIHSEWSEALEEARAGRPMVWHECMDAMAEPDERPVICDRCTDCICKKDEPAHDCAAYNPKPEGVAVELMDGVIRILDWLEKKGGCWVKLDDAITYGAECHEAWHWGTKPLDEMTVAELVDELHAMTAKSAGGVITMLTAAMGIAIAWVNDQGVDAVDVLRKKHRYNKTRPYKHGKKF